MFKRKLLKNGLLKNDDKKKNSNVGNVHDVGYRFLLGLAESLEIERFFAENVYVNSKQAVEILVDCGEDKLSLFIDLVKTKTPENAGC